MDSKSPRNNQRSLPSPRHSSSSSSSSSCSNNNGGSPLPVTPFPITRSESGSPYPTTFVQADTSNFKQVVQMLTGSPQTVSEAAAAPPPPPPSSTRSHYHNIPPIKTIPKKPNQHQSGFKLYERRNSIKNLNLNPLLPHVNSKPSPNTNTSTGSFPSPRNNSHHEVLSPSILDFPSLVLSPVTPLIPDPFNRSSVVTGNNHRCGNNGMMSSPNLMNTTTEVAAAVALADDNNNNDEEKGIKEKGFFLHPSPGNTPRDAQPRLLPLFPTTSPRASGPSPPPSN